MKNELFRKEALENAQRVYDTQENIAALPLPLKLAVTVLLLCFLIFGIWGFRGNITQSTSTTGIIYSKNGIHNIYSETSGIVSDILVKSGDSVKSGDVIAIIREENALSEPAQTANLTDGYTGCHVIRTHKDGVITSVCAEGGGITAGQLTR